MSYFEVADEHGEHESGEHELDEHDGQGRRRSRRHRQRRKRRWFGSLVAVVLSLAVVGGLVVAVVLGGRALLGDMFAPAADYDGPGHGQVDVNIPEGATLSAIGTVLTDADVVASRDAFVEAAQQNPDGATIQSGDYTLMLQMPAEQAVTALLQARTVEARVAIPEGFRQAQVVARIAAETEFTEEEIEAALADTGALGLPDFAADTTEGYLFPATYDIRPDTTAESLVESLVTRFNQAAADVDLIARAEASGFSPAEIVVIASIIQREVRHEEDMPHVAEVIYNRMADGCLAVPAALLQMDSTVHYALGESGDVFTTDEERDVDSPYNTYRSAGLPPAPISSPGEAALNAALSPSGEGYCFFVTVDLETGETKFAQTKEEHDANVAESRS